MVSTISYNDDNYAYAITNSRGSLLFDCGDSDAIVDVLHEKKITPDVLYLSHFHRDHAGGVEKLRECFPEIIVISPKSSIQEIGAAEDRFGVTVIATPGHTVDHCCFYIPEERALISGDTLFAGGCGRCFSGEFLLFADSLKRLAQLPAETKIYPGHEYLASNYRFLKAMNELSPLYEQRLADELHPSVGIEIGAELLLNQLFRSAAQGDFDEFIRLRKMKDQF